MELKVAPKIYDNKGLALMEFVTVLTCLLPFIYIILNILEYYRYSYTLEETVSNLFGNRKEFSLKLDNNFKIKPESKTAIDKLIHDKINELEKNNPLDIRYTGKLEEGGSTNNAGLKNYFVHFSANLDVKKNSHFLISVMPNNINIDKYLLVNYEFEDLS